MNQGKSIKLFLADGTPGGLLTAEIMNWTGHIVAAPRSELPALLGRAEATRTGVYILIGDDPENLDGTLAYIGEGDDVGARLRSHAKEQGGKDFWNRVIILTSKDTNLTKSHARYLESRFISLAREAERSRLDNTNYPPTTLLPEADVSDMEYFIEQARIVLPVLGLNLFRSTQPLPSRLTTDGAPAVPTPLSSYGAKYELKIKGQKWSANAEEIDGEFVIKKGSRAKRSWTGADHGYRILRRKLEQNGTLEPSDDATLMKFTRDEVFRSPSAAAAVVLGRPSNGRTEWKVRGSGLTYGALQDQGIQDEDATPRNIVRLAEDV